MGNTRDHFKKMRGIKRTFHAKMGSIKDRNDMDLTEAEDTKKRWQEYTEMKVKEKSYLTLCDPMDCSLPSSSVPGIFQAIVLEWIAISFSRGYSQPRD